MTRRPPFRSAALVVTLGLTVLAFAEDQTDPTLSAGDFTLKRSDATAFAEPAPVLTYKQQQTFMRGRQHFYPRGRGLQLRTPTPGIAPWV